MSRPPLPPDPDWPGEWPFGRTSDYTRIISGAPEPYAPEPIPDEAYVTMAPSLWERIKRWWRSS